MVYIYCQRASIGARELAKAIGATRVRRFDGLDFWSRGKRIRITEQDIIICWGASVPEMEGVRVLNSRPAPLNKRTENEELRKGGVATIEIMDCGGYSARELKDAGFLPRTKQHQGGTDLLFGCADQEDFWVKRLVLNEEYRIHSFQGRSIRAGIKVPREGFTVVPDSKVWLPNKSLVHPWIRSFDAGWRLKYDEFQSTKELRNLAHKAVKSIGLTFGAVDIARVKDGGLKVLECNQAPGVEGGSIAAYARAITRWIENPVAEAVPAVKVGV